jgi:hypothetical protein
MTIVPSSTFSSSARAPERLAPAHLAWAAIGAVALVGALEFDARVHGLTPRVGSSEGVVALAVRKAIQSGTAGVSILGSSRGLADIDASILSQTLGGRPVFQLSQDGVPCAPMLDALAHEPQFSGTVLCTTEPTGLFGRAERERERTGLPRAELPSLTWAGFIDANAAVALRGRLAVLSFDIRVLARSLLGLSPWPAPRRSGAPLDRTSALTSVGLDTAAASLRWAQLFERGGGESTTAEELEATTRFLAALAAQIERRGGQVLFVEILGAGRVREVETRRYPRARYWDPFVASIGRPAITTGDLPQLDSMSRPDGSHLDAVDAPRFTRLLAEELLKRELIRALPTP